MNLILDPVWPWSRLWDLLAQVPPSIRAVALIAALAAMALPPAAFARNRGLLGALAGVLVLALGMVLRHLWPFAMADAHGYAGSGAVGSLLGLLWLAGLALLLLAPFALAGVSVAAYVGTRGVSRPKLAAVVGLRLLGFLLALVAVARPALAWTESEQARGLLYIVLDHSGSMTIQDERGKQARWDRALRSLRESDAALTRLRDEHQVEVRYHRFADDLGDFDPESPGKADGKRTDFGVMLRKLFDRRDTQVPLRGLLVVSDGADNGLSIPALSEASRWRGVGGTIHTFACGSARANLKQNDVAITTISTSPTPFVPVKGRLGVKVAIDARGFENSKATVRLFLEGEDGKDAEVTKQEVRLPLTTGNEVTLTTDAPARPGEVKVRVVVETPEADDFPLNNTIETFVTVSKEGISVLLVDRQRFEGPAICDALTDDPRIRVTPVWIRGGKPLAGTDAARLFGQTDAPYDVVILGDVTVDMLKAADPRAVERIARLAGRGSGLVVLGGLTNLGNGGWAGTALEPILPVDLSVKEQEEEPRKMVATRAGLERVPYLLKPLEGAERQLAELGGVTKLQLRPKERQNGTELILAEARRPGREAEPGDPLLVMGLYSAGAQGKPGASAARVLVFGGDTTHHWLSSEKGAEVFNRFWRQTVVWLARQEDAEGNVWVKPDVRRLPVRADLGFAVGMRGKGGGPDVRDGKYEVEVTTPAGQTIRTPVTRGATENRGTFTGTQTPGVYRVRVRGEGKDPSGGTIAGEASARVIVYDEDTEMSRPAADPEFLAKLANAGGGGEALRVEQLVDFLNRLAERPLEHGRGKQTLRPDWQTRGRSPFLVLYFVGFCAVVSAEWALRRWWGLK